MAICRPGCEGLLAEELRQCGQPLQVLAAPAGAPAEGIGWLAWQPAHPGATPGPRQLIFERQRLPDAAWLPGPELATLAATLWPQLRASLQAEGRGAHRAAPVTLHVFAPDPTGEHSQSGRAARLERRLRDGWVRALGADAPPPPPLAPAARPAPGGIVWQVCLLAEGAWSSLAPAGELPDPCPGGVHRMVRAEAAPSRSVLKIEEALEVLGRPPQPRERVIDLGAAPGGWSYAFLQRGCRVLAVDNGPLKLPGLEHLPGELTHLRADGLRLQPPPGWAPADWLLSDMLIAPGLCLGLLRKWIEAGWMRRFIVNVKLPQREPLVALRPLCAYLAEVPHLAWRMRQLYHDRREVTVLGEFTAPRPVRAVPGEAPRRAAPALPRGRGAPAAAHPPRRGTPRPARPHGHRRGGHTRQGRRS